MDEDDVTPDAWIALVGRPMHRDVEGLKRALWWVAGGAMWSGVVLGLLMPYILKKLGLG